MICVCSVISVISASYYSEVNLYGFVERMQKCTLHLAMDGAFCGATECGYKYENIIDFVNKNLES